MGRLLSDKEIVNKNVQSYIEKSTSQYSRFLEGTPSFVTYYSKNKIRSTVDEGLEHVQNHLGTASPKYYDKIVDLPIYGIDSISLELSKEEFGLETKYDGSGIILPTTIKPLPNDYFFITYIDSIYLFKINNVTNDKLNGKQFYRIEFTLNKVLKNEDQIDLDGQINKELHVVFDDIGTNSKCVLEKEDKLKVDSIVKIKENLIDLYAEMFYDKTFNIFSYDHDGRFIYNQMATNFIKTNNLLSRKKEFMKTLAISDVLTKDRLYNERYKMSMYHALERFDPSNLQGFSMFLMQINDYNTPFYFYRENYYNIFFIDGEIENKIFEEDFFARIQKNELYEDDSKFLLENIIINYFNDKKIDYKILDKINTYNYENTLYNYIMIPFILFILKQEENKLINKLTL